MTTLMNANLATASPAAAEDAAKADRVGRRLHDELAAFILALPPDGRTASGMARVLNIDRTTCQRTVFFAARAYTGPDLLARLPGPRALVQMVESARQLESPPEEATLAALEIAIERFAELIASMGGSQSRLARHLDELMRSGGERSSADDAPRRARMKLFEAAAELTGRYSTCWVAVYMYRPSLHDPGLVDLYRAHGLAGHVTRPDAVPLTFHNFTTKMDEGDTPAPGQFFHLNPVSRGERPRGRTPEAVLREFTSDPAPVVSSKQPHEYLVQAIDDPAGAAGRAVDFMLGTRTTMPHPATQSPAMEEAWALVNFPCRHLLFDLYLHRDLARACIPSLDTHLWRPDFAQHTGDRWQTRFADSPTLQLLGPGIRFAGRSGSTPEYPRQGELTHHLFACASADPADYIGFRCQVEYPVWRAGYCVSFDFSRPESDAPEPDVTAAR